MATRIREIVHNLYRNGNLSFGESAAIIGAMEIMHDNVLEETEVAEQFEKEYGTMAKLGLNNLFNESDDNEQM